MPRGENSPQRNSRRLIETLGPAASHKKIFCGATRRRTIEKYPWSVLLCGTFAEAFDPPRMLTQCVHLCQRTPGGPVAGGLRWLRWLVVSDRCVHRAPDRPWGSCGCSVLSFVFRLKRYARKRQSGLVGSVGFTNTCLQILLPIRYFWQMRSEVRVVSTVRNLPVTRISWELRVVRGELHCFRRDLAELSACVAN